MKLLILLLTLVPLSAISANSYYPTEYKQIIEGDESPSNLKEILFKIISMGHKVTTGSDDQLIDNCYNIDNCYKHRVLSHTMMKQHLFGNLHLQVDEKGVYVLDYYCNKKFRERDGVGVMLEPINQIVNTEHSWPRSQFSHNFPKYLQTDDLHHLFPTDSRANSSRSSYQFGDVIEGYSINNTCPDSIRGYADPNSPKTKYFEPPNEFKGDIARAMFYFSIRYKMEIKDLQESFLRSWHQIDPVSDWESERNDKIFELQFNRNPFIDYPHLVENISNF